MKGVSIKEWRLLEQAIASNNFPYMTLETHAIVDKAYKALLDSELYQKVWQDIALQANSIVNDKCIPEWKKISEEMQPLSEEADKLRAKKERTEEENDKLAKLDESLAELDKKYQDVTNNANKELAEYKDKRIAEEQWAIFLLEDDEYEKVWLLVGRLRNVPTPEKAATDTEI